jgi:hypothetical protein
MQTSCGTRRVVHDAAPGGGISVARMERSDIRVKIACRAWLLEKHQKRDLRNVIREFCGSPNALFKYGSSRMSQS